MVVQVILGQIRKHPDGEANARHAVLIQRVGGNLHHHMAAARVRHLPEQLLQLIALRRCALRGQRAVSDPVAVGADQPHLGAAHGFQYMLEQQCRGGFAVGTRKADDRHLLRGTMIIVFRCDCKGTARIPHQDIGNLRLRRSLTENRRRAFFRRHRDETVPVDGKTAHGDEQLPRPRRPGIVADV